ncbi:hypothetical protein Aab01nite_06140 [Paractinoplanes abujensis]|uniref:Secreted protein n=1 Tax=Paractinoplanes abujensis TaxID=882441 RepID=A0A7W7CN19_9ACTN|nr:hypothetical protein [Actinoplanes abujensis]MBB4691558.1 hypothetical protein [Actinoplanes abujensis]GID17024.1 hypothetical protein Aab01nite_06140 [Actinoplanes abujensis]
MKAATRILTLVGLSLMTGATLGAAPAMASTSAPDPAARTATTTADQPRRDREWTFGYYDTRRECEWIGRVGERRDRWDSYDCDLVRWGRHRGDWQLTVEKDRDWRDRGRDWRDHRGDDD